MKAPTHIGNFQFRQDLAPEIEIVTIADIYSRHKHILSTPHRCSFYHIILVQKGTAMHHVDFTPVLLEPNSILFIGKETVQWFDKFACYEGWLILFTDGFFSSAPDDVRFLGSTPLFNSPPDASLIHIKPVGNPFSELLKQMIEEQQQVGDYRQRPILKNLLYNFLLFAEREIKKERPEPVRQLPEFDNMRLFRDLLEIHFRKKKSVTFYLKNLNITEKKLNYATSAVAGRTPKEIIDDRVLLEAKRSLAFAYQSIKEICFELGFDEPTNFIKFFRRHTGKTPMEYRLACYPKS